jgi:hypothetical protein
MASSRGTMSAVYHHHSPLTHKKPSYLALLLTELRCQDFLVQKPDIIPLPKGGHEKNRLSRKTVKVASLLPRLTKMNYSPKKNGRKPTRAKNVFLLQRKQQPSWKKSENPWDILHIFRGAGGGWYVVVGGGGGGCGWCGGGGELVEVEVIVVE